MSRNSFLLHTAYDWKRASEACLKAPENTRVTFKGARYGGSGHR